MNLTKINNGTFDNDPNADDLRAGADKINDNFSILEETVPKQGRELFLGYAALNENVTVATAVAKMNARTTVITEKECPILVVLYSSRVYEGDFYYSAMSYQFLFKGVAGTYGAAVGATVVNANMFSMVSVLNLTPADLESNLSVKIEPLGVIPSGQTYIDVANASSWNWSDSGAVTETGVKQYYFRYTVGGELVFAFFTGTPGTYGAAGTPLTSAMFDESRLPVIAEKTKLSEFENDMNYATEAVVDAKISTAVSTVYSGQGDWNASGGQYPSTGSLGQAVRANFTYNVSTEGIIYGEEYDKGDTFYAKVDNPGQDPLKWGRFESNTQQATDTYRGTVLILSGPGTSTTGTMTQKAITDLAATKLNRDGSNVIGGSTFNVNVLGSAQGWNTLPRQAGNIANPPQFITMNADGSNAGNTSAAQVKDALGINGKANDSEVLHTTGNETKDGTLTLKSPSGINPTALSVQSPSGIEVVKISGGGIITVAGITSTGGISGQTIQSLSNVVIPNAPVNGTDGTNKIYVDEISALKADLVSGKVPTSQLPPYVDDVLEFANFSALPATGENGKIYVTLDTNLTYRWSGSAYVEISKSLAIGETAGSAGRGDHTKTAYDHTFIGGNPHGTTIADIPGLGVTLDGLIATMAYVINNSYTGSSTWFNTLNAQYPDAVNGFTVYAFDTVGGTNVVCRKLEGEWAIITGLSGIVSGS